MNESMTLYERLVAEGIETGNNSSDLYFPDTEQTRKILKDFPDAKPARFVNQITGTVWVEVNFAYDPFFNKDKD